MDNQKLVFSVLQRVVRGEDEPMVALIEDLHWLDPTSETFLAQWVDAVPQSNTLLLVNFRPEFRGEWMQKSWYRQLPLAPLGPEAIQELLDDLLGEDPSIAGLAQRIHEHTSGNPFFTEEVVQGLIESGALEGSRGAYRLVSPIERLEIPATVQSLLAARIDRLAEREKHVLQAAAVIGKEFSYPILEVVAELPDADLTEAISLLKAGEFVRELALYPVAEYAFKHPLTQAVALGSQLQDRRRRLNAAAAAAFEEALADRLDESAALIAHHWEEAAETRQALRWHRRAAEWIVGGDPVQAVRHWQRIRALGADMLGEDEVASVCALACRMILCLGGWRLGLSQDEVSAIAEQGRSLAERVGDRSSHAVILIAHGARYGVGGRQDLYYQMAREAMALLDDDSPLEERIYAWVAVGYSAWTCGRIEEALPAFEQVELLAGGNPDVGFGLLGFSAWTWAVQMRSLALAYVDRADEAGSALSEALRLAREYGQQENLGFTLGSVAIIFSACGASISSAPEPRAAALEAMEIAEELDSRYSRVIALSSLASAQSVTGVHADTLAAADQALKLMQERDTAIDNLTAVLTLRSEALRGLGDLPGAIEAGREAVEVARRQPCIADGIRAQVSLGLALLDSEEDTARDEAAACLAGANAWLKESGAHGFASRVREFEDRLAR